METNPELELARRLMTDTGVNLFLTGKAGTGKTTFLKELRLSSRKRLVVLAPTGIAAINAGGMTIHSFFQLSFSPYVPGAESAAETSKKFLKLSKEKIKIIKTLDLLVIDEISMVRADLLDAIDNVLRRYRDRSLPFGGVQLLLIGDLHQLAPVVTDNEREILETFYDTPYFFSSKALSATDYVTIELKRVYRQQDDTFLRLLNRVRDNSADQQVLNTLNSRYIPDFNPAEEEGYIRLTTHNYQARNINETSLMALDKPLYSFEAEVTGDFPEKSYPAERILELKEGAQIMFVKNDPERRFYNGSIGHIEGISENDILVSRNSDGLIFRLEKETWENMKYTLDKSSGNIEEEEVGSFTQYPVKLAWAITIHKSQGLTFDKAIIDASQSFAHGQAYVALSRCRTLDGMVLGQPLTPYAIICDNTVVNFSKAKTAERVDENMVDTLSRNYRLKLLSELFSFQTLDLAFNELQRTVEEFVVHQYPDVASRYRRLMKTLSENLKTVGGKFMSQCVAISSKEDTPENEEFLQQRVRAACNYFIPLLEDFYDGVYTLTGITLDNDYAVKRIDRLYAEVTYTLELLLALMKGTVSVGFSQENFLDIKTKFILKNEDKKNPPAQSKSPKKSKTPVYTPPPRHPKVPNIPPKSPAEPDFREVHRDFNHIDMLNRIHDSIIEESKREFDEPIFTDRKRLLDRIMDIEAELEAVKRMRMREREKKSTPPEKSTYQITLELWSRYKDVDKIAEIRNLKPNTIFNHIVKLVKDGMIPARDVIHDFEIELIREAVDSCGHTEGNLTLTEIRERLAEMGHEEYPWEKIKLALLVIEKTQTDSGNYPM